MTDTAVRRGPRVRYLGAMGTDAAADALFYLTLGWVAARSGGAVSAGVVLAAGTIPQLAVMLLGGALGDRWGLARAASLTLAVRTALFAVFVVMLVQGWVSTGPLIALAAAIGLVDALHMPAMGGLAGLLAGRGEQSSMQGAVAATTRTAGVAATTGGGVLLAWAMPSAGAAMTVLSAVSLGLLLALRTRLPAETRDADPEQSPPVSSMLRDGLGLAARDPRIRFMLVVFALANLAATAPIMLGVPLKGTAYGWSAAAYGLVMMGFAAGSALGALAVARYGTRVTDAARAALLLLVPAVAALVGLAVSTEPGPAAVACLAAGLSLAPFAALLMGEIRERTPESHMGRIGSLVTLSIFALIPAGHLLFGSLTEAGDLTSAGLVMAGLLAATVTVGALTRWRAGGRAAARW